MTNRALGIRLLLSMGIMSLLIVVVALAGRLAVRHVLDTTQEVLVRDAHVSEEALQAHTATLQLRRFEKDYFLNIGAPDKQGEYLQKWTRAREGLAGRIDALDGMVSSAGDHDILREMRKNFDVYAAGFDRVSAAVRTGKLATPQAANLELTQYKDAVRALEETSEAIGSASNDRMRARMALLQAEGAATTNEMTWMAALAVVVAGVVAYRVRAALMAA
jgi:methyl-accepting chemotaxis protein